MTRLSLKLRLAAALGVLTFASNLQAQAPTVLTDRIFRGSGSINLLKDMTSEELSSHLTTNGQLLLGVDLNEHGQRLENNDSIGVAIKNVSLMITTSAGSFSFSDVYTNTTASIKESGSNTADSYHTLFGETGSSQITGSSGNLSFDDVLSVQNVSVTGTILSAQLNIDFLEMDGKRGGSNEDFFDFSAGFEDFAVVSAADFKAIDAANIGVNAAPGELSFTQSAAVVAQPADAASPDSPPGDPLPPLTLVAAMGALSLLPHLRGKGMAKEESDLAKDGDLKGECNED
jgi:hypothetical protein